MGRRRFVFWLSRDISPKQTHPKPTSLLNWPHLSSMPRPPTSQPKPPSEMPTGPKQARPDRSLRSCQFRQMPFVRLLRPSGRTARQRTDEARRPEGKAAGSSSFRQSSDGQLDRSRSESHRVWRVFLVRLMRLYRLEGAPLRCFCVILSLQWEASNMM